MFPDVLVYRLKMIVDPADSSYMPSLVVVSGNWIVSPVFRKYFQSCSNSSFDPFTPLLFLGGNSLNNLIELKTININPTDTVVPLLNDCTEVRRREGAPFWWFADDSVMTVLTISILTFNPFPPWINSVWHVHNLVLLLIRSAWKGNRINCTTLG